jgi:hypothetical protein
MVDETNATMWAKMDKYGSQLANHDTRLSVIEAEVREVSHSVATGNATILHEIEGLKTDLEPLTADYMRRDGAGRAIKSWLIPVASMIIAAAAVLLSA